MASFTTLTIDKRDHVLRIGLNRPDKMNAFNLAMLDDLSRAYALLESDPEVRCAVVYAHGEHFTAGLDLAEVGPAVADGRPLFPADGETGYDPLDLHGPRRRKPVVMAAQGWCMTIGIELLLAADIRLAAVGTRFKQMEVQRGIMAFGGATLRLPQVAGWGGAMEVLLTGDEFGAEQAERWGIVQHVVAPDELLNWADQIAGRIAAQAPLAVQASRHSARIALEEGTEAALSELMGQARDLMASEDAAEGLQSFVERREARFRGR